MMASLYTVVLLVSPALAGVGHHAPKAGCCDVCGVESAYVVDLITRLQTCPRWRDRDRAAHQLRHINWHCHPEVVEVLATALLRDCDEEVREEAAQSLTKMAPCVPVAHEALKFAANCDPDHSTRHWARKGLSKLNHRCTSACAVCGPAPAEVVVPEPSLQGPVVPSTVVPVQPDPLDNSEPRLLAPITGLRRREPAARDRAEPSPVLARRNDSSPTSRLVGRPLRLLRSSNLAPLLLGRDRGD
jgi:HEAT repeat protein